MYGLHGFGGLGVIEEPLELEPWPRKEEKKVPPETPEQVTLKLKEQKDYWNNQAPFKGSGFRASGFRGFRFGCRMFNGTARPDM